MKTIELHELINMVDSFMRNDSATTFVVGEMVGCNLLRHISEIVASAIGFQKILFISGIQDDVYNGKIYRNHVYWASLFDDIIIDGLVEYDPFRPRVQNPDPEYWKSISRFMLAPFHYMIIHDAHKIPKPYLDSLVQSFHGKTILIVDPFERDGVEWNYVDTCVDTFEKLSPVDGFARFLYGVDTRSINKRSKDNLVYDVSLSKRSIGKIDDKQYITSDPYLYATITEKQREVPFRKNQKVMVTSEKINLRHDDNPIPHALTNGTLLNIAGTQNGLPKTRIYASKVFLNVPMSYHIDRFRTPKNVLPVVPANILSIDQALKHRYRHIVFVTTSIYPSISIRDQYSILKMGQNVTFATSK